MKFQITRSKKVLVQSVFKQLFLLSTESNDKEMEKVIEEDILLFNKP
jgi:hypothetical protein